MWKKLRKATYINTLALALILAANALLTATVVLYNTGYIKGQGPEDPLEAWSEASYIVWKYNSTHYTARNMSTLLVEWIETNATTVVQNAENIADDNGGIIYLKEVQLPSGISISANVVIIESYKGGVKIYGNSTGIYGDVQIYRYVVYKEGSTYYAKNTSSNAIQYYGTSFSTVMASVEGDVDDVGGIIYLKNIAFNNVVTLSPTVTVLEDLYGKITYYPQTLLFQKQLLNNNDAITMQAHVYPKAMYYAGTYRKTYFTFLNSTPSPETYQIRAFNHDTESWGSTYTLGTLSGAFDTHKTPAIGVLPNGKLIVFYGAHSTTPLYYRISTNAEDESTWQSEQNFAALGLGWTYPQPQSFSDKLVLFARDSVSATQTRWLMQTTTDGSSWTGWTEIINFGTGYAPYFIFNKVGSKILVSGEKYTYATGYNENLYFAYSDDEGSTWKEESGSAVTLPIDEDQLIATISGQYVSIYTFPLLDEFGKPVVFRIYRSGSTVNIGVATYSAPIGYGGSWSIDYAENDAGTDLVVNDYTWTYPTLYNGKITFISVLDSQNKTSIFKQIDGYDRRFRQIYLDSTALVGTGTGDMFWGETVRDWNLAVNPIMYLTQEYESATEGKIYARTLYGRNYP